jgi:YD repeat-containing protein
VTRAVAAARNSAVRQHFSRELLRIFLSPGQTGERRASSDTGGELISQTNALEQETTLEYDEAGRLIERNEDEGTTTWSYYTSGTGAIGKVSSISAPDGYAARRTRSSSCTATTRAAW